MEQRTRHVAAGMCSEIRIQMEDISEMLAGLCGDPAVAAYVSRGTDPGEALYSLYRGASGRSRQSMTHIVSTEHPSGLSTKAVPKGYLPPFNHNWGIFSMADATEETVFRMNDHNQNMPSGICFSAARAIRDKEGRVRGYVVADLGRQLLTDALSKYSLERGQNVYLVSRNDFIVFTGDRAFDPERLSLLPEIFRKTENGYVSLSGGECYVCTVPVDEKGLRIVSVTPTADILENTRYIRSAALWAGALCAVLCVVFSVIADKDLSKPIKNLTEAFRRLEEGDLSTRICGDGRKDEFGELETGFNTMASKLGELIESTEEKQRRLRMAQSSALQAQINPHFLYNTLDLIKWNAKLGNNNEVSKIAVLLGKLLRSMADFEHDVVTVEEEMALVDRYLEIQSIHRGGRLSIENEIDPRVLALRIPKLIVQPLVENAVVHGTDPAKEKNTVGIRADMDCGYIVFTVSDNGPGMDEETLSRLLRGELTGRTGIGLANVIKRAALYGDDSCGVSVKSVPGEGTTVTLQIRPVTDREGAYE